MPKILKDIDLINTFLDRGVEKIYPSKDALRKKLLSGEGLKVYQGFDPTGPYLHIGHAIGIRALRILQQLGHKIIFLVGDFTSRVGDPDKDKTRQLLTAEQVKKNAEGWKKQVSQLINFGGKNAVQLKYNYLWLSKLKLEDIIKLMSHTTVQQMLERDLFQNRLKENKPIALQEFIYPLMQGYDSVAMQVDMEIGGTDQTFNMLMGRTLCKAYLNKEKFVRTNILMDAPDDQTMSKTRGNSLNLGDPPHEMYGKAMSYPDELITKGLTLLTDVPLDEIGEMEKLIQKGENPMQFKKFMAYEIVKSIKGEKEAEKAQLHFEKTVQEGGISEFNTLTEDISGSMTILEFLKKSSLSGNISTSEFKRTISQGGFEINAQKCTDHNQNHDFKKGDTIKFGKRIFVKLK